jgi:hypothetical protein
MIHERTVIRRNQRVVFRKLADEAGGVLLHLDTAAYHGLNEVGALVWTLLDGTPTFGALLDDLRGRLEDPPSMFDAEIGGFLEDLGRRDLVLLDDGATEGSGQAAGANAG